MRIIAGEFRGRSILPPDSDATRPITDRAKQSLFDILAPWMADATVYDCFAGTGSMGLESLSRGAAHAYFFEQDRSALQRLNKNIQTLNLKARATVISGDIFRSLAHPPANGRRAQVVFLDPPYRFLREKPQELLGLAAGLVEHHLHHEGLVVFRHDKQDSLSLPPLAQVDVRHYGSMTIEFLRLAQPRDNNPQQGM
jgi:16S rRNA (guanine966-N2)-methyltransferase